MIGRLGYCRCARSGAEHGKHAAGDCQLLRGNASLLCIDTRRSDPSHSNPFEAIIASFNGKPVVRQALTHDDVSAIMYTSNAEVLKAYYRTDQITFKFDSTITHTTHSYTTPQDLFNEVQLARIVGDMDFRSATICGATLGSSVGRWVVSQNFQLR